MRRAMLRGGLIAGGGVLGTLARWGLEKALPVRLDQFPIATFLGNITGAFVLGLLVVLLVERTESPEDLRAFLFVGVLGSFTTFSKYVVDGVILIDEREVGTAVAYWSLTMVLGLVAGLAGVRVARR